MLAAGRLREVIAIHRATEAQDSYGQPVKTWPGTVVATVRAEKVDLDGSEGFRAQQTDAQVTTQFTVNHREGITAEMRVVHRGTAYDIRTAIDPDGRKEQTRILCSRSAN